MSDYIKLIKEDDFSTSTWTGGKTTQMFIYPPDSKYTDLDFKVRISSATVELEESKFTSLEAVRRYITPLDGSLRLTHDLKEYVTLQPFEIYEFDGGIDTTSYGKVKDFNIMLANGAQGILNNKQVDGEFKYRIKGHNKTLNIFYSYDSKFTFLIKGEKIDLGPNELLVIALSQEIEIIIKSTVKRNILISSIIIE